MHSDKINSVLETSLKNLSNIVDVSTVIGKPYEDLDGGRIIPVAKITIGIISGGGEYGKISLFKNDKSLPFSGGNGSIIDIKPYGFLVKDNPKSKYRILTIGNTKIDSLIEKTSEFLSKSIKMGEEN